MKYKVSELEGAMLDLAVAKAERLLPIPGEPPGFFYMGKESGWFAPSTSWAHGGPIIERELETIDCGGAGGLWKAEGCWKCQLKSGDWVCDGSTPLIAAMRCYVASKYGKKVEL